MHRASEYRHVSRRPVPRDGVPGRAVRPVGARGGAGGAAGRLAPAPAGVGGDGAGADGGRREPASGAVRAAPAAVPAADPPCPACEYASDVTRYDPVAAFCAGVVQGLGAAGSGGVTYIFRFCQAHRAHFRDGGRR
jgi:hypothetical protein